MLLRVFVLVIGLLELLVPKPFVDFWMAFATDDDGDLRPWVYTVARIEGIVFVAWALARRRNGS